MIRNAGGIATDDAMRSLIVSHHLLDTQEFIIINHTDCGLLRVKEYELGTDRENGYYRSEPAHFHAFDDLEENVRQQVGRVKSHPWIPKHIPVRGFVYDVKTGKLRGSRRRRLIQVMRGTRDQCQCLQRKRSDDRRQNSKEAFRTALEKQEDKPLTLFSDGVRSRSQTRNTTSQSKAGRRRDFGVEQRSDE